MRKATKNNQDPKKHPSFLLFLLTTLTAILAAPFTINALMIWSVQQRILTPKETSTLAADCILILGAGVKADGTPSDMLQDRLLQGIALYDLGSSGKLLVSGDHGQVDYDEVNTMKLFAISNGVPSNDIFMDHAGFSTYESLYRAKAIFQVKKIIIVTQQYHLYRALYVARALGLDAYGVASDYQSYTDQSYYSAREMAARVKDFFMVILKPEPTLLGKPIPITGDGDWTNDQPKWNYQIS
ncbi:MAG TPA: ElyC/SanA/YdcF family protein [Bacillota bacterium]|nr:ElyC/SanA/YdcF family protein [Bacillota bacterium]